MKTITFLLSAVLALCWLPSAAQTKYYNATQTFYESGYTYQCDVDASKMVYLYNKTGKWTYEEIRYKATGKKVDFISEDILPVVVEDSWTRSKCLDIVTNAFTYAQAQSVQKAPSFTISMYINSTTGKVDEVLFNFAAFNAWATIPISVYRKIETDIKNQIWFTPTDTGKTLNYILLWFEGMPEKDEIGQKLPF